MAVQILSGIQCYDCFSLLKKKPSLTEIGNRDFPITRCLIYHLSYCHMKPIVKGLNFDRSCFQFLWFNQQVSEAKFRKVKP